MPYVKHLAQHLVQDNQSLNQLLLLPPATKLHLGWAGRCSQGTLAFREFIHSLEQETDIKAENQDKCKKRRVCCQSQSIRTTKSVKLWVECTKSLYKEGYI